MTCQEYNLFISESRIIIACGYDNESISIDRNTQKFSISTETSEYSSKTSIFGIWGVIKLISGYYLITIDEAVPVGDLFEHRIFRINKSSIIRVAPSTAGLSEEQKLDEEYYCRLLNTALADNSFYFSHTYDMTRCFQKSDLNSFKEKISKESSIFSNSIEHFSWNFYLFEEMEKLLGSSCRKFYFPIINGFFKSLKNLNQTSNKSLQHHYYLISRRNVNRVGPRYLCRGIDDKANVANFVETEFIIRLSNDCYSFVQIRGSIPLFWNQNPNLKYAPPIRINDNVNIQKQEFISRKHMDNLNLSEGYGKNICINLINSHGGEGRLADSFRDISKQFEKEELRYVHFDFHKECGSNRWHRLSELEKLLEEDFKNVGIYHMKISNDSWSMVSRQKQIFRTNCIDCLDRTNVVQSLVAKVMLNQYLLKSNVLSSEKTDTKFTGQDFEEFWPDFEHKFRNLWADHADAISIHYSGTPALKTDFTRTGKRTNIGKLNDGLNSAKRYVLNNFFDGSKQDSLNILLGHYRVYDKSGSIKPTYSKYLMSQSMKRKYLPYVLLLSLSLTAFTLLFPQGDIKSKIRYFLLFGVASAASLMAILKSPDEFIDKPILELNYYNKTEANSKKVD